MLNELFKRLSGSGVERRAAERVRRKFPVAWIRGSELVPAAGVEISERGILFATKVPPPGKLVDVAIDVGTRRVRARLSVSRLSPVTREGVQWTLVAGVFQGIAADDWDAVVRFCRAAPEPGNRAAEELSELAHRDDDAYRLLPLKVQQRVVAVLAAAGRLAPWDDGKSPLLRMTYLGASRAGAHRLAVHSRRTVDGEAHDFDSVMTVDEAGNVALDR